MKLEMNDEQLNALVSKAILDALDEEQRDKLIQGAILALLKTDSNGSSDLKLAFGSAVYTVATKLAEEALTETHREQIRQMFAEAAERALMNEDTRAITVDSMAGAIRRAITGERY